MLRPRFLAADVGITGANFLIAETGSSIIVTNEGNGDLTQTLPRVHIVVTSLEKIVPTLEDAATLLRLLARSATGQEFSSYTTISTGPRRAGDLDGPEQYHVVLLDNGRSALLGGEFQDMLRCLRCAACLNHCPVYAAVGGHAYGWVYPGPMGAVLTPALVGVGEAGHLPNASTFCGRCESVCPVKIPLPKMMRHWREREFARRLSPPAYRSGPAAVGLGGAAPGALSRAAGVAEPGARLGRRCTRPVPQPAAGRRLDRGARHAGAARAAASRACGPSGSARAGGKRDERTARRYSRRHPRARSRRGPVRPRRGAELAERVAAHRRNLVPARAAALDQRRPHRAVRRDGRGGADHGGAGRLGRRTSRPRWRAISPPRTCRPSWSWRPIRRSTRSRGMSGRCCRSGAAAPKPHDAVSLTPCLAAIAETGTLMLVSGAGTPDDAQFSARYAHRRGPRRPGGRELRGWLGPGARRLRRAMPRTVNFITGPSRTGDIEQRIQLGAHGPRRLHVVLVEDAPGSAVPMRSCGAGLARRSSRRCRPRG